MSNYFKEFPVVDYKFGNEETTTRFQHLGTAVDILHQVKEYAVYYQTYHIQNGERPEQLSYKLYGNVNHYWTFYLLNDHLRQGGWPLRDADVYPKAQEYYPNTVLAVDGVAMQQEPKVVLGKIVWMPSQEYLPMTKSTVFVTGNYLYFPNSKVAGKILKIDQKMAMIWTDAVGVRGVDTQCVAVTAEEGLAVIADPEYVPVNQYAIMQIEKKWDEFDAPHHYEDVEGNWIYPSYSEKYPNPFDHNKPFTTTADEDPRLRGGNSVNTMNSVSYYQRLLNTNDVQKEISVIKADNINRVVSEFNRLLRSSN
jgi:hypothetical protein